jgi:hypothetical protein
MLKNIPNFMLFTAALLFITACATQPDPEQVNLYRSVPGFFTGIWHGFFSPLALLASLFSDTIRVYAFPNSGWWYDFGFLLGAGPSLFFCAGVVFALLEN